MRKKCFLLSCVSLFVAMTILSGCGTTNKFVYPYKSSNLIEVASQPKYDLKVAVLPFTEERGNRNISSSMWLYLIPVLSIGKLSYERPEAATMFLTIHDFEFDVSEDLAKAAVTSLKKSNLFQNVYFSYGGDIDNADFILTGDIVSTYYEGKVFSYGTSVFCPYLWLVGLPCGDSTNHLQINLTLSKNNENYWQYRYNGQNTIQQGFYYNSGDDGLGYSILMEQCMNELIRNLESELPSIIDRRNMSQKK